MRRRPQRLSALQLVRHLQRQNAALTSLTDQLREERARVEEAAVGAERARIAQELHDVVGHEVTLIAIQAEAATAARDAGLEPPDQSSGGAGRSDAAGSR